MTSTSRNGYARLHTGRVMCFLRACLLLLVPLLCVQGAARAFPPFVAVVDSTYHPKAGGTVAGKVQSCLLCHLVAGQPKFTPYGMDVKAALASAHTKTLTPEILHSLDAKDSDGDGFSNGAEFAADTLPGEAASKPAGTPPTARPVSMTAQTTASSDSNAANPYDLKTLLLPRHAQHPVIVHFPIALFIISLFFDVLGLLRRDKMLATTGYLNLTIAAVTAPLALITGLLAWQFAYGGIGLAGLHGTLLQHLVLSIVTTILIWLLWGMRYARRSEGYDTVKIPYLVIGLIALMIISLTGHLGGYLSGVN